MRISSPSLTSADNVYTLIISVLDRTIWYTAGCCFVFPLNYHYTFTNHCEPCSKVECLVIKFNTDEKSATLIMCRWSPTLMCGSVKLRCYGLIVLQRQRGDSAWLNICFSQSLLSPRDQRKKERGGCSSFLPTELWKGPGTTYNLNH